MKDVFEIFWKSLNLYFKNIVTFIRYMNFPVLGQLAGWLWILTASYLYIKFLPNIIHNNLFNNFSVIFLILLVITLPGLFILFKAFWEYLIAYGAINSMLDGLLKSGKVYDFPAHNEIITRKTAKFIGTWILISILSLIAIFPIFWIPAVIFFVYFILVFQVFVFEPDENVLNCFKRSFCIIKGHFAKTFLLMILIGALTTCILPNIIIQLLTSARIIHYLAIPFDAITTQLPIKEINSISTYQVNSLMLASMLVSFFINSTIIGFTLPLRTICWGLWYKKFTKAKGTIDKRILKRAES